MNLDYQLKILKSDAPKYGVPELVMSQAVNPILKEYGLKLRHPEYHVLQTQEGNWVVNTLSKRTQPELQKKVIYAFANIQDALSFSKTSENEATPIPMFVTHILFQLFATQQVDSIIFMITPDNVDQGAEISRLDLQNAIRSKLEEFAQKNRVQNTNIA